MDGKLGGAVMACAVSVAEAIEQVLASDHIGDGNKMIATGRNAMPDWAGTPLQIVTGDDGSITVIVPPAPLQPVPTAHVPIPGAALMLLGALATLWRFRK